MKENISVEVKTDLVFIENKRWVLTRLLRRRFVRASHESLSLSGSHDRDRAINMRSRSAPDVHSLGMLLLAVLLAASIEYPGRLSAGNRRRPELDHVDQIKNVGRAV